MKSALSIVLVAALMGGEIHVAAAEPGPIARAIEREAARLASQPPSRDDGSTPILKDTLIGAGIGAGAAILLGAGACSYNCRPSTDSLIFAAGGAGVGALVGAVVGALGGRNSRSVFTGLTRRDVAPGTELLVSTSGAAAMTRYFVNAGDTDIVVLNTGLPMPRAAARTLQEISAQHPETFLAAEAGSLRIFDNLRLSRDGVFLSDRKVAELSQILERIPRADLEAGRSTAVIPGSQGKSLAARIGIGIGVGFGAGVFTGAALCIRRCGG